MRQKDKVLHLLQPKLSRPTLMTGMSIKMNQNLKWEI